MKINHMKHLLSLAILITSTSFSQMASAALITNTVNVSALKNSTSDGHPKDSGVHLVAGQEFSVTSTGAWSDGSQNTTNADGYTGRLHTFNAGHTDAFTVNFAALVGKIDNGHYFLVGNNFDGFANATGNFFLAFADTVSRDNFGSINSTVTVPEPETTVLFGLGLLCFIILRRRTNVKKEAWLSFCQRSE